MSALALFRIDVLSILLAIPALAISGESVESAITGTWRSEQSGDSTRITFYQGGTFAIETKKYKLPTFDRKEGGYIIGNEACQLTARDNKRLKTGNLWMAYGESRCCYNVYFMGKTLVMDGIRDESLYRTRSDICQDRTLVR